MSKFRRLFHGNGNKLSDIHTSLHLITTATVRRIELAPFAYWKNAGANRLSTDRSTFRSRVPNVIITRLSSVEISRSDRDVCSMLLPVDTLGIGLSCDWFRKHRPGRRRPVVRCESLIRWHSLWIPKFETGPTNDGFCMSRRVCRFADKSRCREISLNGKDNGTNVCLSWTDCQLPALLRPFSFVQ